MRQRNVRVLLRNLGDHIAPQLHGVEDVGLVYRTKFAAAFSGRLEAYVRNSPDLGLAVTHGVKTLALAVGQDMGAARLAKIDVARKFAQDQDIQPGHHFRLECRCIDQFLIDNRGAQVGEKIEFLAQPQNGLLGTLGPFERVVLRVADGPEQDRISLLGQCKRRRRQRVPRRLISGAANGRLLHFQLEPVLGQRL